MKLVKWSILSVAILLLVFIVVTFLLPREYHVERSIEIKAPALLIFANVADLETWQTWNPWNKMDPEIEISYGEKKVGPGASYSWSSEQVGAGTMEIVEAKAPVYVKYKLLFEGFEEYPGFSDIIMKADSATGPTTVTWTFHGETGDKFFAPWMGLAMDRMLGPTYELGLSDLKDTCEAQIQTIPGLPLP